MLGSQIRNASIAWIRHNRGVVIVGRNINGAMNDVEVAELFLGVFLSDRVCSYPVTLVMRFRTMRQELTISFGPVHPCLTRGRIFRLFQAKTKSPHYSDISQLRLKGQESKSKKRASTWDALSSQRERKITRTLGGSVRITSSLLVSCV